MKTDAELFYFPGKPNLGPAYITTKNPASKRYAKPAKLMDKPDAIVIGTGIGGLSIASTLAQKKGMKVLMLEHQKVPGGSTHCHELDGFEYNSGVDSIGDMDPRVGRGLFRATADFITGGKLEWAKMPDAHEICTFGKDTYEWFSSEEKNIEWVERLFPGEGNVRKYYDLEDKIQFDAWAWAITKMAPSWVPESARAKFYEAFGGRWTKYMHRKTADVFQKELGFSKRLAAIFSYMYGNHGRTPEHSPFAFHSANLYHYRYGAYYPVGGPSQIANCVIPIVEAAGGQLAVSTPVEQLLIENGKCVGVRVKGGEEIRCDMVISDASAYVTFMELLPEAEREKHGYPARFAKTGPSPAMCYLFLGYDEEIELPKHIIWHMPSYEGVDPYDLDAADMVYKGQMRFEGMGGYLLSPSARDPVYKERCPGKSTVTVLAEAPAGWVKQYRENPDFRPGFDEGVKVNMMKLVHRHMPMLKGKKPVSVHVGVPVGCNPRAWGGCSLGIEPSGEHFTRDTHWLRPKTPIEGLWLTGQDSFSAGVCGAMVSGSLTYTAITGDWLFMLDNRL